MNSSPELWEMAVKSGPFPSNSISPPFCQPGSVVAALVPSCSPAPSLSFDTWASESPEQLLAPLPWSHPGLQSRELCLGWECSTGSESRLAPSPCPPPEASTSHLLPHLSLQPVGSHFKLFAGCVAQLLREARASPRQNGRERLNAAGEYWVIAITESHLIFTRVLHLYCNVLKVLCIACFCFSLSLSSSLLLCLGIFFNSVTS